MHTNNTASTTQPGGPQPIPTPPMSTSQAVVARHIEAALMHLIQAEAEDANVDPNVASIADKFAVFARGWRESHSTASADSLPVE